MPPGFPCPQRKKTPLLAVLSIQKSVLNSKLANGLVVARNPTPIVAVIVPSSTFQSTLPVGDQSVSVRPSNRRIQPSAFSLALSELAAGCCAVAAAVQQSRTTNGSTIENRRVRIGLLGVHQVARR